MVEPPREAITARHHNPAVDLYRNLRRLIGRHTFMIFMAIGLVGVGMVSHSVVLTTLLLIVCFAALGAGNGALFQLVPLRWPTTTAVAGSMIGELGALGGGIVPNALGLSKQYLGTYSAGFFLFAGLSLAVLAVMRVMQIRWTRTWAEKGGRARLRPAAAR